MLHYVTLHYITLHYFTTTTTTTLITLHYNYNSTTLQLQLQLDYTTLHPAVVGEVTTATIATTPKKHNSNHLSVHQWIRSAIRDSQQLTSPIGFLFLKLPPPPCVVLLVQLMYMNVVNIAVLLNSSYVSFLTPRLKRPLKNSSRSAPCQQ